MHGIDSVPLPIWQELLVGAEMLFLRASPVYWGSGIPKGDDSAVVAIPGFLGADFFLTDLRTWLRRIGYKPYESNIGWNAECPNRLIRGRLTDTVQTAYRATHKKVHLIGHSLGGVIARSLAAQMPDRVASVITMGSPVSGLAVHPSVRRAVEMVRARILKRHGQSVAPDCYTTGCTCSFSDSLRARVPESVCQTVIYTKADGMVDWRCCRTGDPAIDFEVSATHIGMVFSPLVYQLVAQRLAGTQVSARNMKVQLRTQRHRARRRPRLRSNSS